MIRDHSVVFMRRYDSGMHLAALHDRFQMQEAGLFLNHAIVNPPIDRHKPAEHVKDVFVHVTKETDAGIYVSGAKVLATSSALTHYNLLAQASATVLRHKFKAFSDTMARNPVDWVGGATLPNLEAVLC